MLADRQFFILVIFLILEFAHLSSELLLCHWSNYYDCEIDLNKSITIQNSL
jgi:hypothetical protein